MASSSAPVDLAPWQQLAQAVQEQLQQQNQQQAQQIGEMHQQMLAMQREIQSLRLDPAVAPQRGSAAANAMVAEPVRSHNELLRAAKRPDCFRGEHGVHALNWLQEMDIFMENCEPAPSESQKIALAKSFLRDEALRWWCAREKDAQRALVSGDATLMSLSPVISTWAAFQSAVKDYFCPRGSSDEARNELHRLRQHQFRSLEAYADRFETVSRRIEVAVGQSIEEELIATFKAGLANGLVRLSLTSTKPRTLFQAIQQAQQAESDLRVSGAAGGQADGSRFRRGHDDRFRRPDNPCIAHFRSGVSSLSHTGHSHFGRPSSGSAPMDLSVIADADVETVTSRSDSDGDPSGHMRADHSAWASENDSSSSSPLDVNTRASSEFDSEQTAVSASTDQLNVAQVRKTVATRRCDSCGQFTLPPSASASECWKCGQPGHLRRDCPKATREGVAHRDSRSERHGSVVGKSRHF